MEIKYYTRRYASIDPRGHYYLKICCKMEQGKKRARTQFYSYVHFGLTDDFLFEFQRYVSFRKAAGPEDLIEDFQLYQEISKEDFEKAHADYVRYEGEFNSIARVIATEETRTFSNCSEV